MKHESENTRLYGQLERNQAAPAAFYVTTEKNVFSDVNCQPN